MAYYGQTSQDMLDILAVAREAMKPDPTKPIYNAVSDAVAAWELTHPRKYVNYAEFAQIACLLEDEVNEQN